MTAAEDLKNVLLCAYATGALSIREHDDVDATTKKMLKRMEEIDALSSALREERDHITSALLAVAYEPSKAAPVAYSRKETEYAMRKPFRNTSLTDACLKVLKDHFEEWLDKNQVEELVARGGYESKAEHTTNSIHVTLRRLTVDGYCESHSGRGSRTTKYRFLKDREPSTLSRGSTNHSLPSRSESPSPL
jgi:hypothetical protein